MKIIKTSMDAQLEKERRERANAGCKICPCCGEDKSWVHHMRQGEANKGISYGEGIKRWRKGIFRGRTMQCDIYRCSTCGAVWESDPYEID